MHPAPAPLRTVAALVLALAALPSTAALAVDSPLVAARPFGLLGDESVAVTDDARAAFVNPAALGARYPSELFVAWSRDGRGRDRDAWRGTLAWRGLALGADQVRGERQSLFAALALGDERLRLGVASRLLSSEVSGERTADHTFGALARPSPWLSLGATLAHPGQPKFDGVRLGREYTLGLGLRPLALSRAQAYAHGGKLTLGADVVLREGAPREAARVRVSAALELLPGLVLRGALEDHGGARVGVSLLGPGASLHAATASDELQHAHGGAGALSLHGGEDRTVFAGPRDRRVAVIRFGGYLGDEPLGGASLLGSGARTPVAPIHRALERALEDPLTRGVLLEIGGVGNAAQIDELRVRIARLRAAGKPVVTYLETGGGRGDLLLAAACDRIVTTPEADFVALGLRIEKRYWRAPLERWGVRIDRASHGRYKSAYREYSVDSTDAADRESIEYQLDAAQGIFVGTVAADRHMSEARLEGLLDGRRWPTRELQRAGLVDSVGYREEAIALVGTLAGLGRLPKLVNVSKHPEAARAWTVPARVAVVYASGDIATGASGNDLLMGATLGHTTLIRQLERAFRSRDAKAVVLRVESPGGSSVASDLVQHRIARLVHETKKPFVVSMGGVAASGGYHIAMNGRPILAGRATRTGSIGILFLHPSLEGLYEKQGVRQQVFERGEAMRGLSIGADWDAAMQASADSALMEGYRSFVHKVAFARGMDEARVDSVARGRVWLGAEALRFGLVDRLGTLEDAIAEARRQARIPAGERIRLLEFRRPRAALLERLVGGWVRESWERSIGLSGFESLQQRAEDLVEP